MNWILTRQRPKTIPEDMGMVNNIVTDILMGTLTASRNSKVGEIKCMMTICRKQAIRVSLTLMIWKVMTLTNLLIPMQRGLSLDTTLLPSSGSRITRKYLTTWFGIPDCKQTMQ